MSYFLSRTMRLECIELVGCCTDTKLERAWIDDATM